MSYFNTVHVKWVNLNTAIDEVFKMHDSEECPDDTDLCIDCCKAVLKVKDRLDKLPWFARAAVWVVTPVVRWQMRKDFAYCRAKVLMWAVNGGRTPA